MTADSPSAADIIIIGASASGLMCAIEAGKRGRNVLVLDHANKAGKKILMSGGGRCNFTNLEVSADNFISDNPHFCKSALSRYTQWDFIALVNDYRIPYEERDLGKLFCINRAKDILNMLLSECKKAGVVIQLRTEVSSVKKIKNLFFIQTSQGDLQAQTLVVASGGLSIPKMCASPIGYKIAEQFGHSIRPTRAGLVPFTLHTRDREKLAPLSGIAVESLVSNQRSQFRENILFTHRGLSGPAILQISSYWQAGETIDINLLPDVDIIQFLKKRQSSHPNSQLKTQLGEFLPKQLIITLTGNERADTILQNLSHRDFDEIAKQLQHWQVRPNATEGYRTAEVTLGGIDCNQLSSRTMESGIVENLYFIGEVVDVSGWLGGYNFQWAWSSGWSAGQVV